MAKSTAASRNNQTQAIMAKACENADGLLRNVDVLSTVLADVMQQIHGGRWSVDINHKSQFVAICQDDFASSVGGAND
jgi:hypothetical protein